MTSLCTNLTIKMEDENNLISQNNTILIADDSESVTSNTEDNSAGNVPFDDDIISVESDASFPSIAESQHLSQVSTQSGRSTPTSFQALISADANYDIVEYELMPGYRQTSTILYAEEQIYRFNTNSPFGISYVCSNKNCNARLYIVSTNQCIRLPSCPNHNHETKAEEYKKLVCLNEIKRRCGELKHLLTGQRVTVRDIFNDVMLQHPGVSLDFLKYERTLQNIRSIALPKNPITCGEILLAFENENVMNSIGRSQNVNNPIFFNGVVEEEQHSFCVFSSKYIMDIIDRHIDENSRFYLLDATFKKVPVGPFNQLLIFYINYIDKAYPFIYVLMSRKTEASYSRVLQFIEENVFALRPAELTTDYEVAMRNALQKQYPGAKFVTSWFHFTQAVKQNASKVTGFINFLRSHDDAEKIYYKLMSLPLLPSQYIKQTFDKLKSEAFAIDQRKFVRFINYYEKQWMEKEGPDKISVFQENIRTTASLEAYNHTLGDTMAKKGHFYKFAVALNKQEYVKSLEMEQYISSGGLTGNKRKRAYKDRNTKIQDASVQLTAGAITPMDFLNRILHNDPKLCQDLSDFANVENSGSAEIDQYDFEVIPENMGPVAILEQLPSTSQAISPSTSQADQNNDSSDDEPPPRDGMCIVCLTNVANVLLYDRKHMAACDLCHSNSIKDTHIENCHRCIRKEAKDNKITTHDIAPEVFNIILEFKNKGQLSNWKEKLEKHAVDLIKATNLFGIDGLRSKCEEYLIRAGKINVGTACEYFIMADVHNSPKLKATAWKFILENSNEVKKTSGYTKLKRHNTNSAELVESLSPSKPPKFRVQQ